MTTDADRLAAWNAGQPRYVPPIPPLQLPDPPEPPDGPSCDVCGCDLEWEDCGHCGGDGFYDVYDDDPLWYDPDDVETCDWCEGRGGYYECPNAMHHAGLSNSATSGDAAGGE